MPDAHANLAYSTVAVAPSPAASGTTLTVATGHGTRFPAVPHNATVWATGSIPLPTNAEIVRVTNISGDVLTITRAQEGTSARSIIVGDQIAATITAKTLTDVEDAISVVSNALSVETAARVAAVNTVSNNLSVLSQAVSAAQAALSVRIDTQSQSVSVLSQGLSVLSQANSAAHVSINDRISVASALASAADAHASIASAAATSADGHAAAASAAATSVDARVNTLSDAISVVSNALSALEVRVSTLSATPPGGAGSVTSAEHLSTDNRVSLLSAVVSTTISSLGSVDNRTSVLSGIVSTVISALASVDNRVSIASALASAADAHASIASAAATSADGHAATASAAATSADGHANTASAAATSADGHAAAASAAATSVLNFVQGVSALSAGGTSVKGLQSVVNALSNRISAVVGGTGSVTSAEVLNAISADHYNGIRVMSAVATLAVSAALGDISGMSIAVSAGGVYQLDIRAIYAVSATGQVLRFGMTFPTLNRAAGYLFGQAVKSVGGDTFSTVRAQMNPWNEADSGVDLFSMTCSLVGNAPLIVTGVLDVQNTGTVQLQWRAASVSNTVTMLQGSYMRVFKLQ